MRILLVAALVASASLSVVAASAADAPAQLPKGFSAARMSAPLKQRIDPVVDGRIWHCEGEDCSAAAQGGMRSQPIAVECKRAAQAIGAFSSYQSGPEVMTAEQLATCNASAKKR